MEKKKVLIVEDDTLLQTTFMMFVSELGYTVSGVASDGAESVELCKTTNPDIVLMDIHLPGKIDGISAAGQIQNKYNKPVVYLTSDIQDSTVKRAIEADGYGYLLKPVSKNSLKITIDLALEKFKYDQQIAASKKRYQTLVEDSPDAVAVIYKDYCIQFINSSGLKLSGIKDIKKIQNKKITDFFSVADNKIFVDKIKTAFKSNKKIKYFPLHFKSVDDKTFLIGISGSVIDFNNNKAVQLIISDHTEKYNNQQVIDKQLNIIENIDNAIIIISENGVINYWNKGSKQLFGFDKKLIIGKHFDYLCQSDDGYYKNKIYKKLKNEGQYRFSMKLIHNFTGKPLEVYFSMYALKDENNRINNIVCYCTDITEKRQEIAESTLYTKATFKSVFDRSPEAIVLIDKNKEVVDYNRTAEKFFETVINRPLKIKSNIYDIVFFFNHDELSELINNVFDGITHYLERTIRFENEKKFLKINIHPIVDNEENIEYFYMAFFDVTKRKKVEQELEDIKNELKPMFDSSIQRFYLIGLDYRLIAFNKSAYDIIQKEFNKPLKKGDNIVDYVSDDITAEEFIEHFESAKKGNHVIFKERHESDDEDKIKITEVHMEPIVSDKGDITRVLLWTLDITETEKIISALKESEERYLLVAKGGNDGLWDWNLKTNELFLSPRWKSFVGYSENEYISRDDVKNQFIHPDDKETTKINLRKHLRGETEFYANEYRLKHKEGHYLWILERGLAIRDENGKPYRIAGSITDITEQKKNAEKLEALNTALMQERNMFLKGNVVVFRLNSENFNIKYISSNIKNVLGFPAEELIANKTSFLSLIHQGDRDIYKKERDVALMQQELHTEFSIYRLNNVNGSIVYVKDFISVIKDEKTNKPDLLGYFIDVTSEKIAEQKIIENQKKYFNLFSKANDAIIIIDNYQIIDCNEKAEQVFGYTKQELINNNLSDLSPETQPGGESSDEKRKRKISQALEGDNSTFYWQYKRKNGELFDSEVSLNAIEINNKKYLNVIIRDISKRKKIEKDLIESKQRFQSLFEAMPDMIFILDKNGKYIDFKPDFHADVVVEYNEVVGKTLKDYFNPEKEAEFLDKMKLILNGTKQQSIQYSLDTPQGLRHYEARLSLYNNDKIFVQVRDFTDLKLYK